MRDTAQRCGVGDCRLASYIEKKDDRAIDTLLSRSGENTRVKSDFVLCSAGPMLRCMAKGRKERSCFDLSFVFQCWTCGFRYAGAGLCADGVSMAKGGEGRSHLQGPNTSVSEPRFPATICPLDASIWSVSPWGNDGATFRFRDEKRT